MNLNTTYMGLKLKHPVVASASPLTESVENIQRLAEAGAAAVVMCSLFEEQLKHDADELEHFMEYGAQSFPEALSYFPRLDDYRVGPAHYLEVLRRASAAVDVPVIGSLNGISSEGWIEYAAQMEEAGASGIELNAYHIPADAARSGREVEQQYLDVLAAVKRAVGVPVALKLSPFFSSMAHMATQFDEAGADALVLFNRFYQPDVDVEALEVVPSLQLSSPHEVRLPLRWIAMLHGRVSCSLAATSGVHDGRDVVKYLLAGADAVMTTSALLRHGIEYVGILVGELEQWLTQREYESVEQMKGSMSQRHVADPGAFERANYIKVLENYKSQHIA